MNRNLSDFILFATGVAIGSVVTWTFLKTKYEQIAQEEIDSVKEVFARRASEREDEEPVEEVEKPVSKLAKPELSEYAAMVNDLGYDNAKEVTMTNEIKPYVIAPEQFGELDDYETVSLTYYADGVLADEWDEKIENVDYYVGKESLRTFGQYEDDCVYVRNDDTLADYEILRSERRFDELHDGTYPMEG